MIHLKLKHFLILKKVVVSVNRTFTEHILTVWQWKNDKPSWSVITEIKQKLHLGAYSYSWDRKQYQPDQKGLVWTWGASLERSQSSTRWIETLWVSHLHSWQSLPASCCAHGATLLFFMNLLLKEAEDRVPDAKHSFFIKSSDDMRLLLKLVHCVVTRWPHGTDGGPHWRDAPLLEAPKSAAASSPLPAAYFKIIVMVLDK